MKKILSFLAMTASILMVSVSCHKPDDEDDEEGGGETKYEAPITIDGNFSDWAKLPAADIAEARTVADATHTALKLVKVYADEVFIFVYFEWDKDQISYENGVEHVPFHCYVNGDGDSKTGGFSDQFSDACSDALFEGFIYPDGVLGSYDPSVYKWIGDPNGSGWGWSDGDAPILASGSGLCAGAGIEGKYEFQITRELYPLGKIADNFSIGFDIQQSWDSVGVLPNAAPTDDNPAGTAPSLQVKTVKKK
jgi:hypothetical protein